MVLTEHTELPGTEKVNSVNIAGVVQKYFFPLAGVIYKICASVSWYLRICEVLPKCKHFKIMCQSAKSR